MVKNPLEEEWIPYFGITIIAKYQPFKSLQGTLLATVLVSKFSQEDIATKPGLSLATDHGHASAFVFLHVYLYNCYD